MGVDKMLQSGGSYRAATKAGDRLLDVQATKMFP